MKKNNLHKAYAHINVDMSQRTERLYNLFDRLLETSKTAQSELLRKLKPTIVLSMKWRFDYLIKTMESPFELEKDVAYWISVLESLSTLGDLDWFDLDDKKIVVDPWKRTAEGFDYGWTKTTAGKKFDTSRLIAKERSLQMLQILGGTDYVSGKKILDSGCGPGRYIDVFRSYNPASITGMDQGKRLIEVLKERFKDDCRIDIVHGTAVKLEFPDNTFDFVLSNGVLHHTSANLETMIKDHARVLKPGGAMYIMLVGKGGLELKIWEFLRDFLYDVPMPQIIDFFGESMSPLRMQGIVDHMYGEYQETSRDVFEGWCKNIFSKIERVPGISGLDVTPEIYQGDPYFSARFGDGNLRYLCYK
jgi:ubiquinone/menaquinone biosynthesis C-methylase UbiE